MGIKVNKCWYFTCILLVYHFYIQLFLNKLICLLICDFKASLLIVLNCFNIYTKNVFYAVYSNIIVNMSTNIL